MKEYLSIGEVSKMKGVSVKSLRYYAKLGILPPAYINPKTGYRYYTTEQMFVLDLILTCLELEIPLKQFHHYQQPDKTLNIQKMLGDGQAIAQKRLQKLNQTINEMQTMHKHLEKSEQIAQTKGVYQSAFPARFFVCQPYEGDFFDIHYFMYAMTELYRNIKQQNLQNRIRQGVLFYQDNIGTVHAQAVLEIEKPRKLSKQILKIQKGIYPCEFFSDQDSQIGYEKYVNSHQWNSGEAVLFLEVYGKQTRCEPAPLEVTIIPKGNWSF